ncbi:MAG TPA: CdaR family protein [Candidatus Limnocylindrales bacterium]|nr:CdaR family protein [Candidatus Limnocylindrales bacterium]
MGWFGNLRLKLLAIACALAMWGGVAYAENPTTNKVFSLTLDRPNVPAGLVVLGSLPPIQVTVVGSAQTLRNFDQRSLTVSADFSRLHAGSNRVAVQVHSTDPTVPDSGLDYQSAISVLADEVASADLAVTVQRLHQLPSGFHEVATAVNPAKVTVHGPKSELAGAQAVVQVDLADQQAVIDQSFSVSVLDPNGHKISQALATPAQVEVKVTIEPDAVTETKAAGAAITGQPAPGYHVTNIQVTPLTVSATGLADVLSALQQVASDPVDVSNQTADVVKTVALRPPAGVQVSPRTVQVHVFIAKNPQASPTPG